MSLNDNEKSFLPDEDEQGGGGDSQGGKSGEIHFRYKDVMSIEPRDDALPLEQINHLKNVHKDVHKGLVDKQKETIKARMAAKEGKKVYSNNKQGLGHGYGATNNFKAHWINNLAQFSGMNDKEVNQSPTLNEADTNDKLKNDLEYRLNYRPGQKFHPKPQMR